MIKNTLIFILAIIISAFTLSVHAENIEIINLTDAETDLSYQVRIHSDYIQVSSLSYIYPEIKIQNALACSVANGVFSFYVADSINKQLCVYTYNPVENTSESFAVNVNPLYDKLCFASDDNGNIYFVSKYDSTKLCVYNGLSTSSVDTGSQIRQILFAGNKSTLVICDVSTFIYSDGNLSEALPYPLSYPVCYTGNRIITDENERVYFFEGSSLLMANTPPESTTQPNTADFSAANIESAHTTEASGDKPEEYSFLLIKDNYYSVPMGTTVAKIKKAFATEEVISVAKADGNIIDSGKVGTASKVTFNSGKTITLIVLGELTGEGNINSRDAKAILNHLSEKNKLAEDFRPAADVNLDGEINSADALLIAKLY